MSDTRVTRVVIPLLALCIVAIALGFMGSMIIIVPDEDTTLVNVNVSSGIIIPQYLITTEVEDILLEISREYPDSVVFADNEVALVENDAINQFEKSLYENEIHFDMDSVYLYYNLDPSLVIMHLLQESERKIDHVFGK